MQKEMKFKVFSNLKEIYSLQEKAKMFHKNGTNAEIITCLYELIELQKKLHTNEESAEDTRVQLAEMLFQNVSLAEGAKHHIAMFKALMKLKGAQGYRKPLTAFIKWLMQAGKTDKLLDLAVDDNLAFNNGNDKTVIASLVSKYQDIQLPR